MRIYSYGLSNNAKQNGDSKMKIEAKIKTFEKSGAQVSAAKYMPGFFVAKFQNGSVVEFCEQSQSIKYGYDEASQESLRFFYSTPKKAIEKALAA